MADDPQVRDLSVEQAAMALNVAVDADAQQVRAAYLDQVKRHPPDGDPEGFEKVHQAYELLRDPRSRLARQLFAEDPMAPLVTMLEAPGGRFRFVGPEPWLEVLRARPRA